jgi:hypothetical protein
MVGWASPTGDLSDLMVGNCPPYGYSVLSHSRGLSFMRQVRAVGKGASGRQSLPVPNNPNGTAVQSVKRGTNELRLRRF